MELEKPNRPSKTEEGQSGLAPGRGQYNRHQSAEDRKQEQIDRLLEATMAVMVREGYAGATVTKICEHAGMSRATFYNHFSGIMPALLALHDVVANSVYERIEEDSAGIEDPFERLRAGVKSFMSIIAENQAEARVIFREIRSAGPAFEIHREEQLTRYVNRLMHDAQKAYKDGFISAEPNEDVLYCLIAGMEAVAMRYVFSNRAPDVQKAVPKLVELVLRALM